MNEELAIERLRGVIETVKEVRGLVSGYGTEMILNEIEGYTEDAISVLEKRHERKLITP